MINAQRLYTCNLNTLMCMVKTQSRVFIHNPENPSGFSKSCGFDPRLSYKTRVRGRLISSGSIFCGGNETIHKVIKVWYQTDEISLTNFALIFQTIVKQYSILNCFDRVAIHSGVKKDSKLRLCITVVPGNLDPIVSVRFWQPQLISYLQYYLSIHT